MKRSAYLSLAVLLATSGCADEPKQPKQSVLSSESTLTEDEQMAIRDLPVYQRDLEALGNIYKNIDSAAVRTAVLDMRAKEIIRLLGEARTKREVYNIEKQMIPEEMASAKNALLDKKASFAR